MLLLVGYLICEIQKFSKLGFSIVYPPVVICTRIKIESCSCILHTHWHALHVFLP